MLGYESTMCNNTSIVNLGKTEIKPTLPQKNPLIYASRSRSAQDT